MQFLYLTNIEEKGLTLSWWQSTIAVRLVVDCVERAMDRPTTNFLLTC